MLYLTLMLQLGCITSEIDKSPGDFPDNLSDDYDNDGLSEFDGDCDDLNQNKVPACGMSTATAMALASLTVEACQVDLLDLDGFMWRKAPTATTRIPKYTPTWSNPVMARQRLQRRG